MVARRAQVKHEMEGEGYRMWFGARKMNKAVQGTLFDEVKGQR